MSKNEEFYTVGKLLWLSFNWTRTIKTECRTAAFSHHHQHSSQRVLCSGCILDLSSPPASRPPAWRPSSPGSWLSSAFGSSFGWLFSACGPFPGPSSSACGPCPGPFSSASGLFSRPSACGPFSGPSFASRLPWWFASPCSTTCSRFTPSLGGRCFLQALFSAGSVLKKAV